MARVAEKGWSTCLVLTEEVLAELRFWKENLRKLNGQKIRREAGVQVVCPRMLYSDAGGNMAVGCMIVNKKVCDDSVFQINLSEEEVFKSSTYRELRGIEEGMKALASRIGQRREGLEDLLRTDLLSVNTERFCSSTPWPLSQAEPSWLLSQAWQSSSRVELS